MSYPLTQFARRFWTDESRVRQEFRCPFLVWESPAREHNEELWMGTQTGAPTLQPRVGEPLVFPLVKGSSRANAFGMGITVGRTDNNDIVLPDQSVSRFHAFFQQDPKTELWKLTDAESKNGTFVAGQRLAPQEGVQIESGARLRFGDLDLTLMGADAFFEFIRAQSR
jgi:hypothetical protein